MNLTSPKKPAKPRKPRKPKEPQEFREQVNWIRPKNISKAKTKKGICEFIQKLDCDKIDLSGSYGYYQIRFGKIKQIENPQYRVQYTKYLDALSEYEQKLEAYEKAMKTYDQRISEWEDKKKAYAAAVKKERHDKKMAQYNKLKKELGL